MQRSDLLLGEFESVTSVFRWDDGELVRLAGHGASPLLAYVPGTEEAGRHAQETMAFAAGAGVPECRRTIRAGSGATALVLEGAEDARPLALVHDLPAVTLRAGLTALLRTLNQVHARGIVHGSIDRTHVLADPSGRFWLIGWGSARPVSDGPRTAGSLSEATVDLRDLACAFREALLRRPWPDPQAATIHDRRPRTHAGQDLIDAGVRVDRDFARVLSRLVGCDPREVYSGATDVLVDLSVEDATAFDPWAALPVLGTRREVARVLRLLDDTQRATSETVRHASSVEYVGPASSGKSRLLAEIARAARARDVIVLTAEGGARGTWGGVGALARQLVQLLGRDARMCRQHEDALRHLLDDRDPSARPQPQAAESLGIDGRNTLTASCTAALTDMVRIAFRTTPGLLLLDDEENLPAAARDVWRASGQFVQAINGAGGVLRALLVSASTRSYPAETGAHRVTVEMRTWRQRDLEKFLARVFASPGGTRDVSVAIHRITGGRPGDVIAYLRDLESRGALRREGLRWRLDVPLAALPAVTGGVAEQVRRALDSCGRDATALVEVLAVAADVSLGRSAVAEISDVRGPRLASAAESAIAAGLLVPDGSAWRVRTDAIAHKVRAAIPDDHRKVLHREVLQFLLDTAPAALDPIAHHARASSDPRAAAWTEQAIAEARGKGDWTTALRHADLAAVECGRNDVHSTLLRAELLAELGRPGNVIQLLDAGLSLAKCSSDERLLATTAIVRALYDAREWTQLISRGVPETTVGPSLIAELRYYRAAAMCHLSMRELAHREVRLATAELVGPIPDHVALARLEFEYQDALYSGDWTATHSALLGKIRIARNTCNWRQTVLSLTKLGNAARFLARDSGLSHAILVRAIGVCRQDGVSEIGGTELSSLYAAIAYTCLARGVPRRACRHFDRSAFYAAQTGVASLAIAARLRSISCAAESGQATYDDKQYIDAFVASEPSRELNSILSAGIDLGMCLLFYGHQAYLERLAVHLKLCLDTDHRAVVVEGLSVVGRMWLLGTPCESFERALGSLDARDVVRWLLRRRLGDLWLSGLVYSAIHPVRGATPWIRDLVGTGRIARIVTRRRGGTWGTVAAALGLALWIPIEHDSGVWAQLLQIVRAHRGTLPVALEWQRVLMESRELMRSGQYRAAQSVRDSALEQLELIANSEQNNQAAGSVAQWQTLVAATSGASLRHSEVIVANQRSPERDVPDSAEDLVQHCAKHWTRAILGLRKMRHGIVRLLHVRELRLFEHALISEMKEPAWHVSPAHPEEGLGSSRGGFAIMSMPEVWTPEEAMRVAAYVQHNQSASLRTVVLSTLGVGDLRGLSPGHANLVEASDGCLISPGPLLGDPTARREWFGRVCRASHSGATPMRETLDEVARYRWPGGLAELETVVNAAIALSDGPVTAAALQETGWAERVAAARTGLSAGDDVLIDDLRLNGPASVGELSQRLGRPKRTLLRHAQRLTAMGIVLRSGRGRATRYRASYAPAQGVADPPHGRLRA